MEIKNQHHLDDTMTQLRSLRYHGYSAKPWEDAQGNVIWPWIRIQLAKLVFSQAFEMVMGALILGNLILIWYETDVDATCFPEYASDFTSCPTRSDTVGWIPALNLAILLLYSLECLVRLFAEQCLFWWNRWNLTDFVIVLSGWLDFIFADVLSVNLLRMSRLIRVSRAVRLLISIPEFYLLINGLYSSIKAILFGALLLVAMIVVWAVIAVQLLHPITSTLEKYYLHCERCPRGFSTVFQAGLTLFQQLVAGDSWGTINLQLVEEAPWTMIILFGMMMTITLGLLNLILAVIVERAAEARENDHEEKIKQKENQRARSMEDLARLCATMDVNNNGLISLVEMQEGYDDVDEFAKLMQVMDMKREDMETVFNVMADNVSQEVSYLDFCQSISSFFKRDPVIMQSLIKFSVMEVRKILQEEVLLVLQEHTAILQKLLPGDASSGTAQGLDHLHSSLGLKHMSQSVSASWSRPPVPKMAQEPSESARLSSLTMRDSKLQVLLSRAEAIAASALDDSVPEETPGSGASAISGPGLDWQKAQALCTSFREREMEALHLQKQCHQIVHRLNTDLQSRYGDANNYSNDTEGANTCMYHVERF